MKFASFRRAMESTRLTSTSVIAVGLLSMAATAQAVPVIPGGAGFGIETPAGRGGTVYRVTNLNASGSGSLKACVDGTTARTCVFEVSGTIRLTSDLTIRNNRITIAGQTAPSPGIMIRGAAIKIQASDVLIQHLRVRPGDDTNGPDPDNRDALKLEGTDAKPVRNVVIDHCSFSWSIDEVASVWGPNDNITFTNNIFAEPLSDSLHPNTSGGSGTMKHGFGVILGPHTGSSVTMIGNLFAHIVERNPLSRASELVFVNNLVYDRGTMDLDLQSEDTRSTKNTVLHNVFRKGPSYARDTSAIFVHTGGSLRLGSSSRVYQAGNVEDYPRELLTLNDGNTIAGLLNLGTYPVWNGGLKMTTGDDLVYNRVLNYAGARPKDRDAVDKRIVSSVKNRNGQVINCVASNGSTRCNKNGGGWPSLTQNRRTLTLPSSQSSIASNGYSNLENWLHTMDQSLSGTVSTSSPISPASLSVQ